MHLLFFQSRVLTCRIMFLSKGIYDIRALHLFAFRLRGGTFGVLLLLSILDFVAQDWGLQQQPGSHGRAALSSSQSMPAKQNHILPDTPWDPRLQPGVCSLLPRRLASSLGLSKCVHLIYLGRLSADRVPHSGITRIALLFPPLPVSKTWHQAVHAYPSGDRLRTVHFFS